MLEIGFLMVLRAMLVARAVAVLGKGGGWSFALCHFQEKISRTRPTRRTRHTSSFQSAKHYGKQGQLLCRRLALRACR